MFYRSPIGTLEILSTSRAVTSCRFLSNTNCDQTGSEELNNLSQKGVQQLQKYFAGDLQAFDLPLVSRGTSFERSIRKALINIPYGTTVSYGLLAQQIGLPRAARAVARVVSTNPYAIIIPCHRVIRKDGKPGGYAWGLERKRWLIDFEKSPLEKK